MTTNNDCYAKAVARLVVRAGFPVIAMRTDVDEKKPSAAWTQRPWEICRTERDLFQWADDLPRWATICGVPRVPDGRALICLDADSAAAVAMARRWLPDHTRVQTGRPEGGEHTWMTLPADHELGKPLGWRQPLLRRFYIDGILDWRGGNCIALLPGSLWEPVSHPEVVYTHISGPALPEVLDVPKALANVVMKRAPTSASKASHRPGQSPSGEADLSGDGAFEKFLAAVSRSGRIVKRVATRAGVTGEAFVQCPGSGHPDQNRNRPCLHVTARGGGIGLHCFGGRGCTVKEIVAALDLTEADLYDALGLKITIIDEGR